MVHRRLPNPSELRELLRPAPLTLDATARRLSRGRVHADLRTLARRRAPRAVFDYTDGAAGVGELALRRARRRSRGWSSTLRCCTTCPRSTRRPRSWASRPAQPFALAPTGFTRMMHTEGERAVVAVAEQAYIRTRCPPWHHDDRGRGRGRAGRPQVVPAVPCGGTRAGQGPDRTGRRGGYDTLMLTVDTRWPAPGLRDVRNGIDRAAQLTLRTFVDGATHPRWCSDLPDTEPLSFASLTSSEGTVGELIEPRLDPAITMADLEWRVAQWPGKLVARACSRWPTRSGWWPRAPTGCCCPATVAASWTAPRAAGAGASVREAVDGPPRCSSTPASPPAPTSCGDRMGAHPPSSAGLPVTG